MSATFRTPCPRCENATLRDHCQSPTCTWSDCEQPGCGLQFDHFRDAGTIPGPDGNRLPYQP